MPRKKRVIEYIDEREVQEPIEAAPMPHDAAEESYDAFVGQFAGEGVRARVYRQVDRGGKQYCFWGAPAEVDEESIRLFHARQPYAHEAGIYIVQVDVHGEYRNSFTVPIAPQIATPGAAAHNGGGNGSNDLLLKMLMDQNARLEQRLFNQQAPEREPISALADAMLKMNQMQQQSQPQLPIETIMKAIELGKSVGQTGDWKTELFGVMKEAMPAIQTVMQSMRPPAVSPAQAAQLPAPAPAPTDEAAMLEMQLKMGIQFLKGKCIAGSDPGLYIEWIIDNREVSPYAQLIHAVVSQPLSSFVQLDPEISRPPYETFFATLYNGLRSAFTEPDTADVDSSRPSGNAGDVASHAKPGAKRGKG